MRRSSYVNYYVLCLVCWILLGITGKISTPPVTYVSGPPSECDLSPSQRSSIDLSRFPRESVSEHAVSVNAAGGGWWSRRSIVANLAVCRPYSSLRCVVCEPFPLPSPLCCPIVSRFSREVKEKKKRKKRGKRRGRDKERDENGRGARKGGRRGGLLRRLVPRMDRSDFGV